ncbi:MAG: RnfABCDGE type electron transport complex subunit D [Hyphomicrobiaceae bacterium]|nr:RnfABCDGE type electron transport complex subunit D [Hyphomicrobiaceae bacterium]
MNSQSLVCGPHAHSMTSISNVMMLVILALLPTTLFGLYVFGWPAIFLFLVTIVSALFFEAICLAIAQKSITRYLFDGSALLTGWLVAMTLPPWAPWWIGVLGSGIAIIIGKHLYGGLGQNPFNPAMVARIMLLISFPLHMTTWIMPAPLLSDGAPGIIEGFTITFFGDAKFDAISQASVLDYVSAELGRSRTLESILPETFSYLNLTLGQVPGCIGETSALLILIGGVMLLITRTITWHIPVSLIVTTIVLASICNILDPNRYPDAVFHLTSGSLIFCAFFIATDYVTSPTAPTAQLVYGVGIALLTFVIRTWAAFPEGVGFAILFMNACTPLIDHFIRPRVFGRNRSGKPLLTNTGGK